MSDLPSSPSVPRNLSEQSTASSRAAKTVTSSPGQLRPAKPPLSPAGEVLLWLFGILLPIATIGLEATEHWCAEALFDPIPTWWQLALAALVPGANIAAWIAIVRRRSAWLPRVAHLNAFALGVSAVYVVLFLPLTPFAVMGLAFFGLGLLPLTPLISFWALTRARGALLRGRSTAAPRPKIWIGFTAGVVALALPYTHDFITREMLTLAASNDAVQSRRGVALLRTLGSRDCLLRTCYNTNEWARFAGDIFGLRRTNGGLVAEDARAVYYRVTGEPYNSVPAPASVALPGRRGRGMWNFDDALGGSSVASKVPGLSMQSSRLDGKIEVAAGTNYVEWTMVFKNIARN